MCYRIVLSLSQIVSISPSEAQLEPGERRLCRITFTAVGFPSFYDIDLICEVRAENSNKNQTWNQKLKREWKSNENANRSSIVKKTTNAVWILIMTQGIFGYADKKSTIIVACNKCLLKMVVRSVFFFMYL